MQRNLGMRKALVVGINYYTTLNSLTGCVPDACSVKNVLERHSDGSINFSVKSLMGLSPTDGVLKSTLRQDVQALFAGEDDIALFYFAGHGHIEATGGYLCTSDSQTGNDGVSLSEVVTFANQSKVKNRIIILDSCHAGVTACLPNASKTSEIADGFTILAASTAEQYASEIDNKGVFTTLFVDAMNGGAANLTGDITPGSIYAYIDQSLGPWDQRPVFKTNVKNFVSLRKVQPAINLVDLRRISEFFPEPGAQFLLNPSFEPERSESDIGTVPPDPENTRIFSILQSYNRVNLVVPVDAPHMWHAAMASKSCKLTVLGEHYRQLAARKRL